jgi:hypothetical protein
MFQNTSQATTSMLFNAERPRFDSRLRSARQRPQRAAGARNTAARERWVSSFRYRRLPRRACAAVARERLDSRFLKVPDQAGCRGSGAPPGAQSCAAGAQSCAAGAHAASPCHARVGDSGDHQRPPPPQAECTPDVPTILDRCAYALTRACSVLTWTLLLAQERASWRLLAQGRASWRGVRAGGAGA